MLLLYTLLCLTILVYVCVFRKKPKGKTIPGPSGFPFVGRGLEINSNQVHNKLSEYADLYGDIVQVKMFFENIISLNSADLIRKAFCEDPYRRHMNDRSPTFWRKYIMYDPQSTGFYLNAFGGIHGDLRKGLTRTLHFYGDGIKLSGEDLKDGDDDVDVFWKLDSAGEQMFNIETNAVLLAFPFLIYFPGIYRKIHRESQAAKNEILRKYFTHMKVRMNANNSAEA